MEKSAVHPSAAADDRRTRARVTALLLEQGPQTASELAARLGISPAAVRRHLDALTGQGRIEERLRSEPGGSKGGWGGADSPAHRGRGRPARRP